MNAYFLSLKDDTPTSGYWDYALLEDLLEGFERVETREIPKDDCAVVVIPGRSHAALIDKVNEELKKIGRLTLFIMGDEEHDFPVEKIDHKNCSIWLQNPEPGRHDSYNRIGCGYTPHVREFSSPVPPKDLTFFFAGQNTHTRREEMLKALRPRKQGSILIETEGFTQGVQPPSYCVGLSRAKIAPCPSGPQTPDTFRVYEALELGCIPIADEATPKFEMKGFWNWLFDETVPFPTYIKQDELLSFIPIAKGAYPIGNNQIQSWWYRWKMKTKEKIRETAGFIPEVRRELITVIVPISPISSHPDTKILEETIGTIRHHLPKSKIILTFDGIRDEQMHLAEAYNEHIRRVLWLCRTWKNVEPHIFEHQSHQVAMAKVALEHVIMPLILYVEQDTPIVTDEPIEWEKLIDTILSGKANMIRLHFEGVIPKDHSHLMIGEPEDGLQKTVQWSQRPHLASTPFYQEMLATHFTENANCFIEDKIHGAVQDDWNVDGEKGWEKWKMFIYHPMTGNIKRSYNLDGRGGDKKYDEAQIW